MDSFYLIFSNMPLCFVLFADEQIHPISFFSSMMERAESEEQKPGSHFLFLWQSPLEIPCNHFITLLDLHFLSSKEAPHTALWYDWDISQLPLLNSHSLLKCDPWYFPFSSGLILKRILLFSPLSRSTVHSAITSDSLYDLRLTR